ncbi:MAG TPA: mechanosensitive ion channel domain-containing protein [Acidiferrobacterales bacterium]
MDELLALLPTSREVVAYLMLPATWWQVGVIVSGLLAALLVGQVIQRRLQPVIQPGVMKGLRRMAMRTGVLVTVPLAWWLWLLAGDALLRQAGRIDTVILNYALLLVGALTLIRMAVFVLRHSFSPGSRLKAWEGAITTTVWVLVALHILGWLPAVIETLNEYAVVFGTTRVSLYTIVSFLLSSALLVLAALWIATAIGWQLSRSQALDESVKVALSKLTKFLLLVLAVLIAMVTAGIDLTALAVFGGALGVGLGLGMQRIVSNFVSGIILSFEGSIRPGDVISTGNTFGVVQALHARHIVVRNRDGMDILIPNENLLTTEITNWSYADRHIRFRLPVAISYADDPDRALEIMERAARDTARVLTDPPPVGRLMGFGDNGIELELRLWVNDPENGVNNVRSDVYRRIFRDFRAAGITIPFPQRDLHIKQMPERDAPRSPET